MKIKHITDFRSLHNVLTAPMTEKELKENVRKDGTISAKVLIDLSDLVSNGIDWLNDEVSEKITGSVVGLSDIDYTLAGRTTTNQTILKVSGSLELEAL